MIGRKTTLALANLALGTVLGLVAYKLIALYYGDHFLGQMTYAVGLLGLFYFVTDLGMGQAHVKRVSEGRDPGDCFATFAVFKLTATLVFLALVVGGLAVFVGVLGKPIQSTTLPIIGIVLFYYAAKSMQEIAMASFEARLETARLQVTNLTDTLVRVALVVLGASVVAALFHNSGPLEGRIDETGPLASWVRADPGAALAAATAAGALVAAVVALTMLRRVLEWGRFRWDLLKDYFTFALPLFLTSASMVIAANIDSAALGFFLNADDVGVFSAVRAIVLVLGGIAPALGTLLFPTISGLAARGDVAQIQRHMDQGIRYLSMLLVPIVVFTAFFAADVIRLVLADPFVRGATVMGILAFYILVGALAVPHATLIMGLGKPSLLALIGGTSTALILVLDIALIPDDILGVPLAGMGIEGAALGTLAAGLVYYGSARLATRRLIGYRERGHIWRHLAAAVAMALALVATDRWLLPLVHWYHFLLYAGAGLALYLLALVAMREFTRADLDFVRRSVHPLDMLRYVRDELRQTRE